MRPTIEEFAKLPPQKRLKWIISDFRIVAIVICLLGFAGAFDKVWPAPNPTIEQPTFRLQKPAKSKSRCILKMTTQRFMVSPEGRMEYAGGFTVWTACDR